MMQRRGLASRWTAVNPILEIGEFGFEEDTQKFKIGDGETAWLSLPYFLNEDDSISTADVAALIAAAGEDVQTAITTSVATAVAGLVDSAPLALDTLNELAAAMGDDPSFASTMTTALGNKANTSHTHTKSQITDFTHTHAYADITDKPTTFTPSTHTHLWADITDKPTTFTPASHTHNATEITNTVATAITATTYTLQSSDSGKTLILNPTGGAITVTINNPLTVGQRVDFWLQGTSATFAGGTGSLQASALTMTTQYTASSVMCIASGVYALIGSLG
jgi:hypothetical protein